MVMTSEQVSGMLANQNQMFGGVASYAQQITPPMGNAPGMGPGSVSPAYMGPQAMAFNQGPAPMQAPLPLTSAWNPGMMGGAAMALGPAGSGSQQAMVESMLGTAFSGAATGMQGLGTLSGLAGLGSMGLGMVGLGGTSLGMGMAAFGSMPVALSLGAASHAASNMYTGFQQRQQVNSVLRNHFGTVQGIGSGAGGMGFSASEMGGISTMIREMGTEDLTTNIQELTRVLDKTSGMGLQRGVQSAREFRERFKQTVDSLKEVAQIMHTTLEGATEFMSQQRSMGFFSGQDITRQLALTRVASGTTGLSIDQVNSMAQQGAQIARASGGRSRQGAQAGVISGSRLALAQDMGIIDDDAMEFATGMTGAEGAQAFSGRMMQIGQRFMRRRAGRAMVAGLWDAETGGIDQSRLDLALSGGMSIHELRSQGRRSISETGGRRSEFFRDEEELRSQVLAQGGEYLPMAIYGSHVARRRGLSMDDPIVQRLMRRRFRVSQGEVELATNMIRNRHHVRGEEMARGRLLRDQEGSGSSQELRGIQGLGRRLGQVWERAVENPFRQFADDTQTDIERGINEMVDTMEGRIGGRLSEASRQLIQERSEFGRAVSSSAKRAAAFGAKEYQQFMSNPQDMDYLSGRDNLRGIGAMLGMRPDTGRVSGRDIYNRGFDIAGSAFDLLSRGANAITEGGGIGGWFIGAAARDAMGNPQRMNSSDWALGLRSLAKDSGLEDYLYEQGAYNPYQLSQVERARELGYKGTAREGGHRQRLRRFLSEADATIAQDTGLTRNQQTSLGTEYAEFLTNSLMGSEAHETWKGSYGRSFRGITDVLNKITHKDSVASDELKSFARETRGMDRAAQVGRIRVLEQAGSLGKAFRMTDSLASTSGESFDSYEDELEAIESRRRFALKTLSDEQVVRNKVFVPGRVELTDAGSYRTRDRYKTIERATNQLQIQTADMEEFLSDTAVADAFTRWRTAPSDAEKRSAYAQMAQLVGDSGTDKTVFDRLGDIQKSGTDLSKDALDDVANSFRSKASAQERAVHRDLGKQLQKAMSGVSDEALGSKGAVDKWRKLQEVADLRASGTIDNIQKSYEIERELLQDLVGSQEGLDIAGVLAGREGGEYISQALASGRGYYKEFTEGSMRTRTRNLYRAALETSGISGEFSEEVRGQFGRRTSSRDIMNMLSRGGETADAAIEKILAGSKGNVSTRQYELLEHRLKTAAGYDDDGTFSEEEGAEFGAALGGAKAGASRSKSSAERNATAEGQDKMVKHLSTIAAAVRLMAAGKTVELDQSSIESLSASIKGSSTPQPAAES